MIKCLLFILATYSKSNIMFVSLFKSNTFIYQGQIVRAVSLLRLARNAAAFFWPAHWHCFLRYLPAPVFGLMQNYLTCKVLLNISFVHVLSYPSITSEQYLLFYCFIESLYCNGHFYLYRQCSSGETLLFCIFIHKYFLSFAKLTSAFPFNWMWELALIAYSFSGPLVLLIIKLMVVVLGTLFWSNIVERKQFRF